jgi:uncharacterized protein (DUF2062 family)
LASTSCAARNVFLLAGIARRITGSEERVVHFHHGCWKYCDVPVYVDSTLSTEEGRIGLGPLPAENHMTEGFFYRKLIRPIIELLKQGVTPEKMALSLALGVVLGVFPALGWTTALCAAAALILRLNLAAIQIVNYFMYPLQIALIIPFFRMGEKLFGAQHFPLSVPQLYGMIHASMWEAIRALWTTTWHAVVVWGLMAPVVVGLMYVLLTPILRRVLLRQSAQPAGAT